MGPDVSVRPPLKARIRATLDERPDRPWCVHRLCEHLLSEDAAVDREGALRATEAAADDLVAEGVVRREAVSAVSIGVHCEDELYWSSRSTNDRLDDFGPEYQPPRVLQRLASHFQCHGL